MTKAEKEYLSRVAELGCLICGMPAEIHHVKFGMNSRDHSKAVPLCPGHHRHNNFGHAVHNGKHTFEKNYMTEQEMLDMVQGRIADF